jgi:hypothetical protein
MLRPCLKGKKERKDIALVLFGDIMKGKMYFCP